MSKAKSTPAITFANGRWSVGSYSTSAPNKLINHLRKRGVDVSLAEIMALTAADAPVETAVITAPEPDADIKEN
jgi:hypothetical protein